MVDDILEDSGEEAALSKDGVVMVTDKNVQPFFSQVLFFFFFSFLKKKAIVPLQISVLTL